MSASGEFSFSVEGRRKRFLVLAAQWKGLHRQYSLIFHQDVFGWDNQVRSEQTLRGAQWPEQHFHRELPATAPRHPLHYRRDLRPQLWAAVHRAALRQPNGLGL